MRKFLSLSLLLQQRVVIIGSMLLLAISIGGCAGKEDFSGIYLDYKDDILSGKQLSCKQVDLPFEEIYAEHYWMISDSMLVIEKRRESGNFLDIVNPVNGNKYSSLLPYGEGPDDMIFCAIYFDGKYITAVDYIRSRYAKFTPLEAAHVGFTPRYVDFPREVGVTSQPIGIGDSTFLVNPYHYINRSHGIVQDLPRFIVFENDQADKASFETGKFFTLNVGQVMPLVDEVNRKIWLFSTESSKIDIYDYNRDKLKRIRIKDELDKDLEVVEYDGAIVYTGSYPKAFLRPVVDCKNSRILVPYVGKLIESGSDERKHPSYILEFDLEGDFRKAYCCGRYISRISVTPKGIYATSYDEDNMPVLVKFEEIWK